MAGKPGFVPKPLFKKIRRNVPLPTVDALIMKDGRLLLVKRTQEPMKGRWWFVGGRVNKNEKLTHAVRRKVREETGLDCRIVRSGPATTSTGNQACIMSSSPMWSRRQAVGSGLTKQARTSGMSAVA